MGWKMEKKQKEKKYYKMKEKLWEKMISTLVYGLA